MSPSPVLNTPSGQVLVEFGISIFLILLIFMGAGGILYTQWNRMRCAYLVFEKTHTKLTGKETPLTSVKIAFVEDPSFLEGQSQCGRINEKVKLPKLEASSW